MYAVELHRTAPADLIAGARSALDLEGVTWSKGILDSGLRVAFATPTQLDTSSEAVLVDSAVVVARDGTVQWVRVFLNPVLATEGGAGCASLARKLLESLEPGPRSLELGGGLRAVGSRFALEVPANHVMVTQWGHDFEVYYVEGVVPLGSRGPHLGIYLGGYPSRSAPGDATSTASSLFGKKTSWRRWSDDGLERAEALVALDGHWRVHVFAGAETAGALAEVMRLAETGVRAMP